MEMMIQDSFRSAPIDCTKCTLHSDRIQIVYPDVFYNSKDKITTVIIGEAPGAKEDEQGRPFVGTSGKILRKELERVPGRVVITNTVKCRPPENRNPKSAEKKACQEFLDLELQHYNPDFIILVGRISSSLFMDSELLSNFTSLSGTVVNDKYIPVLHPASTMYNGKKNKPIWEESWNNIIKVIYEKFPNASKILTKSKKISKDGKILTSLGQFIQESE